MLKRVQGPVGRGFQIVEGLFDRIFGSEWNPFYHLGALSFFYYWIIAVSGIYLYIVFETSIQGVYDSMEYLTHEQWYLGGIMRSLHRYGSDAMALTMMIHLLREFGLDRFRGKRWFAWFTGVPLIWFLFTCGINGYWLVWDELAQFIAVATGEWIDWLPFLGESVARNFLTRGSLSGRFFSLLVFLHIALPLIMLLLMWLHIQRLHRPDVNPPRGLAAGAFLMLLVLSLVLPAESHAQADLGRIPSELNLDWLLLFIFPLIDAWSNGAVWAVSVGISVFLCLLPWMAGRRQTPLAVVDPDHCNGCGRCFADCPYVAVTMTARQDDSRYDTIAVVEDDLCTGCGICVGTCPTHTPFRRQAEFGTGIDLDDFPLVDLRDQLRRKLEALASGRRVAVFGCEHAADVETLELEDVVGFNLPCIALLPPALIDHLLADGWTEGVLITGCRSGECFNRLGVHWTQERLDGSRETYLRTRTQPERLAVHWAADYQRADLMAAIEDFRDRLPSLDETVEATGEASDEASESVREVTP